MTCGVPSNLEPGTRFGCLEILKRDGKIGFYHAYEVRCDCGNVIRRTTDSIKRKVRQNCGEPNCSLRKNGHKHGFAGKAGSRATLTYKSWANMRKRCLQTNSQDYPMYGGRGITIHPRWDKFENFLVDMGERQNANLSIERKNTNGNYEPGNCFWATQKVQQNNRRNNRSNNPYRPNKE